MGKFNGRCIPGIQLHERQGVKLIENDGDRDYYIYYIGDSTVED